MQVFPGTSAPVNKNSYFSISTYTLRNCKIIGWLARAKKSALPTTCFVTTHTQTHTKAILRRGLCWADSNYSHAVLRGGEKQQQSSSGTLNHVLVRYNYCSKMEAWRELRSPGHCWAGSYPGIAAVISSLEIDTHIYVTHT